MSAEEGGFVRTTYNRWLRDRYGERVHRISVDGGFTCPNRDGTKGRGGCTYCNVDSFTPSTARRVPSIREQVLRGAERAERVTGASSFLIYFQANTNTYAPVERLRALFDEALSVLPEKTRGLVVGTRPDCLEEEKLDLLASYAARMDVTLEIGLESAEDATLRRINRGHTHAEFLDAVARARRRPLLLGVHAILGFPWETLDDARRLIGTVNRLGVTFLKLHQLHVVKGSVMAADYRRSPFPLLSLEEYADWLADLLPRLDPSVVLQRIMADCPAPLLVAPAWAGTSQASRNRLEALLKERGVLQGSAWIGASEASRPSASSSSPYSSSSQSATA